jgi:protein-tyrosine phosphatase
MSPMPDVALGPLGVIRSMKTRDIMPQGWSCSDKVSVGQAPIIIEIDWPDYNVPSNLGREWWLAFVQDVKSKGVKSISTQCMGGHGRTGVQLCILAYLLEATKVSDAYFLIKWVRERFCEHAVEAKCQQDYIADICQIPIGKSAIAVKSHNPWAGQNFTDDLMFTEAELNAQRKFEQKSEAKKKRTSKNKKNKYKSPIRKGWTLTYSEDALDWEWRRTRAEDMEAPCRFSGGKVVQADKSLMDGRDLVPCLGSGRQWHPIEMATDAESNVFLAEEMGMKTKKEEDGGTSILLGRTWVPSWFAKYHKGTFMSWLKYYDEVLHQRSASSRKASKTKKGKIPSFKKQNQRTLSDFTDGDDYMLDDEYQDWALDPDTKWADEAPKRKTNDEIESEELR